MSAQELCGVIFTYFEHTKIISCAMLEVLAHGIQIYDRIVLVTLCAQGYCSHINVWTVFSVDHFVSRMPRYLRFVDVQGKI